MPSGTVVVVGANGAGKTSLLEAIAVLGNLQSFRPGPSASWVQHGSAGFVLAGIIERAGTTVELRQEGRLARTVTRRLHRGARRLGAAEYLDLFPVSVLSSYDRQLVWAGRTDVAASSIGSPSSSTERHCPSCSAIAGCFGNATPYWRGEGGMMKRKPSSTSLRCSGPASSASAW